MDSCARRRPGQPPIFDDQRSFRMDIEDAEIAIDPASLTALVNHAFDYKGSSLSNLRVSFENGLLVQRGTLHKGLSLPFTVIASVDVDAGRFIENPSGKSKSGRDSVDETAVAAWRRAG